MNCWVLNNISLPFFSLCFPWSLLNWTLHTLVISTVSNVACRSFPLDLLAMYDPGVGSVVGKPNLTASQLATETFPRRHLSWSISSVSTGSSPPINSGKGMIVSSSSAISTGALTGTKDCTWPFRHQTRIRRQNSAALGWPPWPPYPRMDEKQFSNTSCKNVKYHKYRINIIINDKKRHFLTFLTADFPKIILTCFVTPTLLNFRFHLG